MGKEALALTPMRDRCVSLTDLRQKTEKKSASERRSSLTALESYKTCSFEKAQGKKARLFHTAGEGSVFVVRAP
jgi:hypothetical protein